MKNGIFYIDYKNSFIAIKINVDTINIAKEYLKYMFLIDPVL